MRTSLKIALLIVLITVVFYWKILLVHQFSLLLGFEGANQAYSWFNFWVATIRQGIWPVWDPFTYAGHPFAGEMQTGAFYPLYLVFLLVPFNHGVFSPQLYHVFYALTHVLCAWFMYLLAREFGLSAFAGLIAGLCFSLGGFVVRLSAWPHLLESAIWLPLILLCLLRAMKTRPAGPAVAWSALGGLCLAMTVLAGGLHVVFMDALVAVSAVVFYTASTNEEKQKREAWTRAGIIVAVCLGFGLAGGAVQLLPSAEYSGQALRFVGPALLPATQRIPYAYMGDGLWPHSILAFVVESFAGTAASGEYLDPYLGVFPMLLAIIGIWKCWSNRWVRYLSGLALTATLYSLGSLTLLHGLFYAVTPFLWMAREADRFMYLADFALAILAGFGLDAIFSDARSVSWESLNRVFRWIVIGCVVALVYPPVLGKGDMNLWISFSLLLVIFSYGVFQYLIGGHRGAWAHFLVVALILFDLGSFDWTAANKIQEGAKNADQLERLLSTRGVVDFLRSRTGPFRVQLAMDYAPNIGDLFGIQTVLGAGVTMQKDFERIMGRADLLNAWYQIRPASVKDPGAVYEDAAWKVYENPRAFPRAWLTHETRVEGDPEKLLKLLDDPRVNLHRTALLEAPIQSGLDCGLRRNG